MMVVVVAVVAIVVVLVVVFIVALYHFNSLHLQVGRDQDLVIEKSFRGRRRQVDSGCGKRSVVAAVVVLGAVNGGGG